MYGVLSDPNMPQGLLLDTIRHVETGGSPNPNYAMGSESELGSMQFRTDMLHDLGYGMPRNIDPFNLMDPTFSRNLADQFIKGYSKHHSFDTPVEKLIAYNMGAQGAADWKARGSNFDELPQKTKDYIRKSAAYLNDMQPNQENNMLQYTAMQRIADNMPTKDEQQVQSTQAEVQPQMNKQDIQKQVAATVANRQAAFDKKQQLDNQAFDMVGISAAANAQKNASGILADGVIDYGNYANAGVRDIDSRVYTQSLADQETLRNTTRENSLANAALYSAVNQDPLANNNANSPPAALMSTDQARKQTPFSLPDQQIGRNEALIRIGGAMMGGSQQGGLAALNAATNQYGSIQDYNRSQALDAYNAAVEAAGKKAVNPNADASSAYQQSTINSIDEIWGLVDQTANNMNPFDNVAGLFGSLKSRFPGNNAYDVDKMLNTIKANVGFDRLQAMRDSSPTGGALGQVTELELKLLQSSLAALDQGMSPKRFREQLLIVKDQYMEVTRLLAQDPALQGGRGGLSVQTDPFVQSLVDQYAR